MLCVCVSVCVCVRLCCVLEMHTFCLCERVIALMLCHAPMVESGKPSPPIVIFFCCLFLPLSIIASIIHCRHPWPFSAVHHVSRSSTLSKPRVLNEKWFVPGTMRLLIFLECFLIFCYRYFVPGTMHLLIFRYGWLVPHTHTHAHAHTRTHTCTHTPWYYGTMVLWYVLSHFLWFIPHQHYALRTLS